MYVIIIFGMKMGKIVQLRVISLLRLLLDDVKKLKLQKIAMHNLNVNCLIQERSFEPIAIKKSIEKIVLLTDARISELIAKI